MVSAGSAGGRGDGPEPPVQGRTHTRARARALGDRQWQDRDGYVHDLRSKGRAATRRKAAPHGLSGPSAAYLPAISSSLAAAPSPRPHRGAVDAERARASQGARQPARARGVRVPPSARCPPVRRCRGASRAAAHLPASRAAAAGASPGAAAPLRRAPSAGQPSPAAAAAAAAPPPGRRRVRRRAARASAPSAGRAGGRAGGRAAAARAGLGGRTDAGDALPAEAPEPPEPRRRRPDTKERPARSAAEYKLINTTPKPESSRSPIRLQQVCSTRKAVTRARERGVGR